MSKNQIIVLTGVLTGPCHLKGHFKKIGLVERGECRFCEEEDGTSIHILAECSTLEYPRLLFLREHQIEEGELP